jgi:single-stranded-DNA-specific exonuclease
MKSYAVLPTGFPGSIQVEMNSTINPKAMLKKRWVIPSHLPDVVDQALTAYPSYLRQILYNRGITDAVHAEQFLNAQPPTSTDPFLLTGMSRAVERIWQAIQQNEPLVIYGDYDVDGVTATVLLVEVLRALGAQVQPYIPNRFDEGYGLNIEALRNLYDSGVRLVITVDCVRSPIWPPWLVKTAPWSLRV